MKFINDGWPSTVKTKALLDFVACQHQLSVCDGCILKHAEEPRIVVPKAIREQLLSELHKVHVAWYGEDEETCMEVHMVARYRQRYREYGPKL